MPHDDFTVVYSGSSFQVVLLTSILDGKGIAVRLEDEFLRQNVAVCRPWRREGARG